MDNYQAIYDAVRSRIRGGDIGAAVREVAYESFDISHMRDVIAQEFAVSAYEMRRPFVLMRPNLYPDGNMWCALYGDDLQSGVAGFGETPEKAAVAFDLAWLNERAPAAKQSA